MSYSISTSNHNLYRYRTTLEGLCLILFLHQTTTKYELFRVTYSLCLILFLHQTTTDYLRNDIKSLLCLILFLHQTTTVRQGDESTIQLCLILFLHQTTTSVLCRLFRYCCVLFYFYIKPQLRACSNFVKSVVSYSISTSNHNSDACRCFA